MKLFHIFNASKVKRISLAFGAFERILVYFAPFVFSIASVVHGILYLLKYNGIYYYLSSCINGSSLYTISVILILTKSMCKWYKAACFILIANRLFEILYYYTYFKCSETIVTQTNFLYASIIFGTCSFVAWFISDSIRKTYALINRVCKRVRR